jgi:hypothetical protein
MSDIDLWVYCWLLENHPILYLALTLYDDSVFPSLFMIQAQCGTYHVFIYCVRSDVRLPA